MSTDGLERVIRRAAARRVDRHVETAGRCELCSEPLAPDHRHLLELGSSQLPSSQLPSSQLPSSQLRCACYACSVLFQRDSASEGHYRLVPERRVALSGVSPAALGVPVGLAFFVTTADGAVLAHYPSPAGATRWDVDRDVWAAAVRDCPPLRDLAHDVEALLVNTARGKRDAWIVPISDCYRLVAVVRLEWKGLSGGARVWPAIEGFFDELRRADGPDQGR